jgi:hypothetical protein
MSDRRRIRSSNGCAGILLRFATACSHVAGGGSSMTQAEAAPGASQRATTPSSAAEGATAQQHPHLDERRPFGTRIPDSSVQSVRKVARLDGRTRIIAARQPGRDWWKLRHRLRFTRDHVEELRRAGVSEVVLQRGMRRASFPLTWISTRRS